MLGYRLSVNNTPDGKISWSLVLDSENSRYGDHETDEIFSIAREFVNALSNLQKRQEAPSEIKTVRHTLAEVSHELSFLHGLTAADGEAPEETFSIDTSELLSRINEADEILEKLEHSHNHDCP